MSHLIGCWGELGILIAQQEARLQLAFGDTPTFTLSATRSHIPVGRPYGRRIANAYPSE